MIHTYHTQGFQVLQQVIKQNCSHMNKNCNFEKSTIHRRIKTWWSQICFSPNNSHLHHSTYNWHPTYPTWEDYRYQKKRFPDRKYTYIYTRGSSSPSNQTVRKADPPIDDAYLGLVVGALAGATADEEEFNCFISLYPIPFAPPRSPLPTPLYPRAMAGGGGSRRSFFFCFCCFPRRRYWIG